MNDELQGVLAELASRLGTTSGELWSWLQSDGIAEYAKVKVAPAGRGGAEALPVLRGASQSHQVEVSRWRLRRELRTGHM